MFERRFPADFICEAIDQTRGWFYSQLAESVLLFDQTDYLNCVCLGLILDPEGRKMSKRLGNHVDPHEVIDAHGADAFRWYYLATQQPWGGYRFSAETVGESMRRFLLTLWNTYAFYVLYANTAEGQGDASPAGEADAELDRWLVSRLQATTEVVRDRLDDFDSSTAGRAIAAYVDEMSNWYVRVRAAASGRGTRPPSRRCGTAWRRRRSCSPRSCRSRPTRSGSTWRSAPIRPTRSRSTSRISRSSTAGAATSVWRSGMEAARRAVELGRAARAASKVKTRQPLARAVIVATEDERRTIEAFADVVRAELNVKELEFVSEEGELASYAVKPNFRSLGPRFGRHMPQVKAAVEALAADRARAAIAGEREIGITIDGVDHTLHPEDISLVMAAARRLPGRVGGGPGRRARPGARRGADPRGPGARGRPGRPERPQGSGARGHRPDRAGPRGRRGAARGGPRPRGVRRRRDAVEARVAYDGDGDPLSVDGRELTVAISRSG